jgi:hypothetical protein
MIKMNGRVFKLSHIKINMNRFNIDNKKINFHMGTKEDNKRISKSRKKSYL